MKKLKVFNWKKLLSFRAYGDQLMTPKAFFWLITAQMTVLIIASIESMSWAYFGTLLGDSIFSKIIFGTMIGTFTFLIIWSLDATLMTLDRGKTYYQKHLSPPGIDEPETTRKDFWKFLNDHELKIGVLIRIAMISVSIYITAPFLNQLVFNKEISAIIKRTGNAVIASKRQALVVNFDKQLIAENKSLASLQTELNRELAGKGLTGKYGAGVVSKNLQSQIDSKNKDIVGTTATKNSTLKQFDQFVTNNDYNSLQENYAIVIPQNNLTARGEAIKPILASEDAKRFEIAIRSFLGFLFLGLILLKFYEPPGIRIYMSESLQAAYTRYMNGVFDHLIATSERYNGKSPMDAIRFEEWMLTVYVTYIRDSEKSEKEKELHNQITIIDGKIMLLEGLREEQTALNGVLVAKLKNDLDAIEKVEKSLRKDITNCEYEQQECTSNVDKCNAAISTCEKLMVIGNDAIDQTEANKLMQMQMNERADQKAKKEIWLNKHHQISQTKTLKENTLTEVCSERVSIQKELDHEEGPVRETNAAIEIARAKKRQLIMNSLNDPDNGPKKGESDEPFLKAV